MLQHQWLIPSRLPVVSFGAYWLSVFIYPFKGRLAYGVLGAAPGGYLPEAQQPSGPPEAFLDES